MLVPVTPVVETGSQGYTASAALKENRHQKIKLVQFLQFPQDSITCGEKPSLMATITNNAPDVTPTGLLIDNPFHADD